MLFYSFVYFYMNNLIKLDAGTTFHLFLFLSYNHAGNTVT